MRANLAAGNLVDGNHFDGGKKGVEGAMRRIGDAMAVADGFAPGLSFV